MAGFNCLDHGTIAKNAAHQKWILLSPIFGLYVVGLTFDLNVGIVTLLHPEKSSTDLWGSQFLTHRVTPDRPMKTCQKVT